LTIEEFCARNRISKQFYYKLRAKGQAPTEMRLGTRVLISKEAAEEWRRRLQTTPPSPAA
jgi:excisionase family DNA binding protein